MTTSIWPKTGPCRTSYTICPLLVQALVSPQNDTTHVAVYTVFF